MNSLIKKQEEETEKLVTMILSKDFKTREELEKDGGKTYKKFNRIAKGFIKKVRKESIEFERERILRIILKDKNGSYKKRGKEADYEDIFKKIIEVN